MKKRILFIDRDGTLIHEPEGTYQVDAFEKLSFIPKVIRNLSVIRQKLDFEFVMVTNQDGLGTDSFPEADFWPVHELMLSIFRNEGVEFDAIHIDRSFEDENLSTRKPGVGMLHAYLEGDYDLENSYVIGDRITDVQLAKNLGCKAILFANQEEGQSLLAKNQVEDSGVVVLDDWDQLAAHMINAERTSIIERSTSETKIRVELKLDGTGKSSIETGLHFFDHMLEQISRHSGCDLMVKVDGDLHVDEHHTIEDTGLALGAAFKEALGDKRGVERYGFCLPMDDCLAQVALDFGGRSWLVWDASFRREKVGDMPTEMFHHFFKSFSDEARCNLNIKAEGDNEHHKIEGIFKSFARAIRAAIRRELFNDQLPSTKGVL